MTDTPTAEKPVKRTPDQIYADILRTRAGTITVALDDLATQADLTQTDVIHWDGDDEPEDHVLYGARNLNRIQPANAPKLTRAAKEQAVTELASRLAGISENAAQAADGFFRRSTDCDADAKYFHRRQRLLQAALVRVAMARTSD
jgi:hypothetical protein